ncbi:MAG: hypothetical protein RL071_909 [Pseudomonadota bacterium]|jgi:inosine/guanosine/xanthosine phosphorylase family protein
MSSFPPYIVAADRLEACMGPPPDVAIVLGSGMGPVRGQLVEDQALDYAGLGLPTPGVAGHGGEAILGTLGGVRVLLLSGRVHSYEGRPMEEVVRATRAVWKWGVKRMIFTAASGSTRRELRPGTLVRLTDHINITGLNPLRGPNDDALGPRFPDISRAYDPQLGAVLDEALDAVGAPWARGVYCFTGGPSYESPAEVRMVAALGGDLVGMSTVPEIIAGAQLGLRMAAVGVVSNLGAGLADEHLTHEDVTRVVGGAADRLGAVFVRALPGLLRA